MKHLLAFLGLCILFGCKDIPNDLDPVTKSTNTSILVVGVENGYAGACPGSLLDSKRMYNLLKDYSNDITLLQDKSATRQIVYNNIAKGAKADLFIMYYSGHGGSQPTYTDKSEVDSMDEFMCCYDGGLLDNDIWRAISTSKGRVVLIFDCCHSETMFRTPGIGLKRVTELPRSDGSIINMLCWSGCPDNTYSYGSSTGGMMTNALLKYFRNDLTYNELWNKLSSDVSLMNYQKVKRTILGNGFDCLVFK